MCIRYLKLNKTLVFSSQHLETLIALWITGIGIEQEDAVNTHTEFFISLVRNIKKDLEPIQDFNNQQEIEKAGISTNEIVSFKSRDNYLVYSMYGITSYKTVEA